MDHPFVSPRKSHAALNRLWHFFQFCGTCTEVGRASTRTLPFTFSINNISYITSSKAFVKSLLCKHNLRRKQSRGMIVRSGWTKPKRRSKEKAMLPQPSLDANLACLLCCAQPQMTGSRLPSVPSLLSSLPLSSSWQSLCRQNSACLTSLLLASYFLLPPPPPLPFFLPFALY